MMTLQYAEDRTILRCVVGSDSLGLKNILTGDNDEMGVMIEEVGDVVQMGAGGGFQQFTHRTAVVRTGDPHARSGPGDLDLKIWSLRKFCGLACDGNPDVMGLLFIPPHRTTQTGQRLQRMHEKFVSKLCVHRYLGYMEGQRKRMTGQRAKNVIRQELIDAYGYDTKFAMHFLRLGEQCIELLSTGILTYPMPEPARGRLKAVREGLWTMSDVLKHGDELKALIRSLEYNSALRDTPDRMFIQKWMQECYRTAWIWGKRP